MAKLNEIAPMAGMIFCPIGDTAMAALQLLTIPFAILNFFGVIVGAVWLAVLGKWSLLGWGVAGMFVSATALSFALVPAILVSMIALPFFGRRFWFLGFPFILTGSIYTNAIIGAWCVFVVEFCFDKAGTNAALPVLLWAYGVAISPLSYMTTKGAGGPDGAGIGDVLVTFCAQIAVVLMGVSILVSGFNLVVIIEVCGIVMIIATVLHAVIALLLMREASQRAALEKLLQDGG